MVTSMRFLGAEPSSSKVDQVRCHSSRHEGGLIAAQHGACIRCHIQWVRGVATSGRRISTPLSIPPCAPVAGSCCSVCFSLAAKVRWLSFSWGGGGRTYFQVDCNLAFRFCSTSIPDG
jgi:hypothetical protein